MSPEDVVVHLQKRLRRLLDREARARARSLYRMSRGRLIDDSRDERRSEVQRSLSNPEAPGPYRVR